MGQTRAKNRIYLARMQDWIINSALIISSEICLDFLSGLSNIVEEIKEAYCLLVVESILRTRVKTTWIQPHITTERKGIRTSAEELKILPLIQKGPKQLLSLISNNCSQGAWLYSTVPVPISIIFYPYSGRSLLKKCSQNLKTLEQLCSTGPIGWQGHACHLIIQSLVFVCICSLSLPTTQLQSFTISIIL